MVSFVGLVISHRTAGPMFQFMRVFRDIKAGKTETRLSLRPGDDFREVAQAFNEMMDKVMSDRKS